MKNGKKCIACITSLIMVLMMLNTGMVGVAAESPAPWMHYTFDNGTGKDSGTAANDATAVGTPQFGEKSITDGGPSGKYLIVDGSNNYFAAPGTAFDFGTGAFTASFWVKFAADYGVNLGQRFFQTGLYGAGDTGFAIALNRDGGGKASITAAVAGTGSGDDFAGTWGSTSFDKDYFDGKWHLITVVFDQPNKIYQIYIDGVQTANKAVSRENLSADTNREKVGIGVFDHYDQLVSPATYMLDDVAFYKSALSSSEIAAYYAANKGLTYDPNKEGALTDPISGITVNGTGLDGADLYVSTLMDGETFQKLLNSYKSFDNFILYNISAERDGSSFTLNDAVSVTLPIPEKLQGRSDLKIIIAEEDGSINTVPAQVENNTISFQTKVLGDIAIVSASGTTSTDLNDGSNSTATDNPSTGDNNWGILFYMVCLAGAVLSIMFTTAQKKHN